MDPRPWPRSRRTRRERLSKRILAAAVIAVIALMGTAAWLVSLAVKWNPVLDEQLCPTDRPPAEEVVVLIDVTDAWNATQRAVIKQEFQRIQAAVPRFGRIHLFAVRPVADTLPSPLLRLCNPGLPSDFDDFPAVGEAGARVVANPVQLEATWRDSYSGKLDSILASEASRGGEASSPLMETLRAAAIQVFGTGENRDDRRRTIHVFSDMLQNSPRYSVYRDPTWTADDGSRLTDPGRLGTISLEGAQVYLYMLDRDVVGATEGHERGALVRLWDRYLAEQGATIMRVRRIEG